MEPGTGIKDVLAGVVVEKNGAFGIATEEALLVGLIHELGAGDGDGFVLFAGARVQEKGRVGGVERGFGIGWLDKHGFVVLVGGEDVGEHFFGRSIGSASGEFGEGFGGGEAAALAASEVIAGKEGAAGTGERVHDFAHGGIDGEFGGSHEGRLARFTCI